MAGNGNGTNLTFFRYLTAVVGILGVFIGLNFLFPSFISFILNIIWILLLIVAVVFFSLGILVIIGMRKEVGQILDVLLEGSLTLLDIAELIKELWAKFIRTLKDFLVFAAPVFAYVIAFIIYVLLLILYKYVGRENDVTLMTIIITVVLMFAVGFLNKPRQLVEDLFDWKSKFKTKFRASFIDAAEVVLFVFFLTMDSTKLFFLPPELNVELKAKILEYDLMVRSFRAEGYFLVTLNLIIAAICMEIFRNFLRLVAFAKLYYSQNLPSLSLRTSQSKFQLIKDSIRKSFSELKDDFVRFITFSTVLFAVFMFFPRLKLFTLVIASFSAVLLDLFIPSRLTATKSEDLISRIIAKVFKV